MDWGFTLSVVLVGIVVVFCVLVILVLMCWVVGKIFTAINNKKNGIVKPKPIKEDKPEKAPVVKAVAKSAAPAVESGIGDDIVAAISAAIACMTGENGGKLAIRSIKRSRGSRPAWNTASIMENTRPF